MLRQLSNPVIWQIGESDKFSTNSFEVVSLRFSQPIRTSGKRWPPSDPMYLAMASTSFRMGCFKRLDSDSAEKPCTVLCIYAKVGVKQSFIFYILNRLHGFTMKAAVGMPITS